MRRCRRTVRTWVDSERCARLVASANPAARNASGRSVSAAPRYATSTGNAPQASANQRSVWNFAAEELEGVGGDEERADGDERKQPERPRERGADPDRDGRDERAAASQMSTRPRYRRLQRAAVQFVECVCAHA